MSNGKAKRHVSPVGLQARQTFTKVKYQAAGASLPDVQVLKVDRLGRKRWAPVKAPTVASA
jgi:hypothetical protein